MRMSYSPSSAVVGGVKFVSQRLVAELCQSVDKSVVFQSLEGERYSSVIVCRLSVSSMSVELMSALRFVGLIFAVMLVALSGMMSCVVMFASLH